MLADINIPANAQEKIWGWTWPLHSDASLLVMRLVAHGKSFCSEHFHARRHNLFIVHEGILSVRVEHEPGVWEVRTLCSGEQTLVEAGIMHQFRALTDVMCDEVYFSKDSSSIDLEDIIRRTEGGRN